MPLMLVVAVPLQRTRFRHRLPQVSQTLAVTAPQATPLEQVGGQLNVPPHASPILPQYCCTPLALLQVAFTQSTPPTQTFLSPHAQLLPAAEQSVPQLSELPHPSPMVPQYWPPEAGVQVSGVQPAGGPALHRRSWQVHPSLAQVVEQCVVDPHPS